MTSIKFVNFTARGDVITKSNAIDDSKKFSILKNGIGIECQKCMKTS